MKREQHTEFWDLYEREALPAIESACRTASRRLSDGQIDQDDLLAWVNERVWKMLEHDRKPTFHDDPSPELAVERLKKNAATLARWAYLGLCRSHWRRLERRQKYIDGMGRAERLATVSRDHEGAERLEKNEDLQSALAKVRGSLDSSLRQKLAASWPESKDRERLAMAMGVAEGEDGEQTQAMIDRVNGGEMKKNAVEQMRSRARRKASEVMAGLASGTVPKAVTKAGVALALMIGLLTMATPAKAGGGQQGGGRGNGAVAPAALVIGLDGAGLHEGGGQQGGGRGGGELSPEQLAAHSNGGQQGGGRGGLARGQQGGGRSGAG